jgi:putative membrane-bound dehydrogenase-like protein
MPGIVRQTPSCEPDPAMTRHRRLLSLVLLVLPSSAVLGQGFPPEEAVKRMQVPDGFRVRLIAAEPMIKQPVTMSFDDRGRLWVIQYLQYPHPEGLKPVSVDQYLRTVYDRIPEPPPKGPKGADRITILEDPDENGRFRKSTDFVTGLNLASGMALGHGGVFVAQPPYLLFYREKDDHADGDPEVLLGGFGMQDSHAFPNSLQWGPDGWLYGAQGSTVTSNVRGIEFQQGIWRYHPRTKEFELFAEGGGNTWGLDFDRHGNAIAGTNFGGVAMLHQVQGGYYVKGFAKHGPLHNAHTYGYFEHVPYQGFKGGHVTCGGIVYQGGSYPEKYNNQYIACNPLSNVLHWHVLEPKGSSFTARHGGDFLVGNDTWFRPIDALTGPDGSVYVADWVDKRINHVDPRDTWDKTNGRVYKVEYQGTKPPDFLPLGKKTSLELVALLKHPNSWVTGEARRLLAERRDPAVVPVLRKNVTENKDRLALESLWALYVSGGFDTDFAFEALNHPDEDVRAWTVRLLGDSRHVTGDVRKRLGVLARRDPSPRVRSQLASTAKRLPAIDGLWIVRELLRRSEDASDPHIPLLLWWAVEDKAITDREGTLSLFSAPDVWKLPLVRGGLTERLARRYMAEGGEEDLAACARLLDGAPGPEDTALVLRGMEKALEGRRLEKVPAVLEKRLDELGRKNPADLTLLRLSMRLGSAEAYRRALEIAADAKATERDRIAVIEVLGQNGKADCVPVLLGVLESAKNDGLRGAALSALQSFPDPAISEKVLALYPKLSAGLRGSAQTLLCSRPASALAFLRAVDAGKVAPKDVPLDQVRRLAQLKDEAAAKLVEKHWGRIAAATSGENQTRIRNLKGVLGKAPGDPVKGKVLFVKHCGVCHQLFGEGNKIGPELTGADRKNRDFLLSNIVDPSAVIRPEYVAYKVETRDGRSLFGLIVESSPAAVTLLNEKNERTVIPRAKIDELKASPISLMPERILDPLEDDEVRHLFAYLQSDGPPGGK